MRDHEVGGARYRVRQALDELGTPEEIAAAAAAESGTSVRTSGERGYDVATVLILLLGNFVVPVLGWTTSQKWLGTLVWPVIVVLFLVVALIDRSIMLIYLLRAAAGQQS